MREILRKGKADLVSGFITALFGIPGGMAYAKLAGVNPLYGLYSGMVPTLVASLATGSALMISTLTSAIAISTHSVLSLSGIAAEEGLFTLTFLIAIVMLLMGVFRMGKIIHYVSSAVMTGFIVGASFLIIIGELGDLVGIHEKVSRKIEVLPLLITHFSSWDPFTMTVGFGSIALLMILQKIPKIGIFSPVLVLGVFSIVVYLSHWNSVVKVGEIAKISSSLPTLVNPDFAHVPHLALGAFSVALVALIQGVGVRSAVPNPGKKISSPSRDFIGQGLGNLFGSFFQSMGTGGSLTRTLISVDAGAKSRMSGVFSALFLMAMILYFGHLIQYIPLAAISGVLCVIAAQIIMDRWQDITLIAATSLESTIVMAVTFFSALIIPLQWTIFLGAGVSMLFYFYTSLTGSNLYQWKQDEKGHFEKENVTQLSSNEIKILEYDGSNFFAEVPQLELPNSEGMQNSVIIWRMRGYEDAHSAFLKWIKHYIKEFQENGNRFILEGVKPHVICQLKKYGIIELIGEENVFPAKKGEFTALREAVGFARKIIEKRR